MENNIFPSRDNLQTGTTPEKIAEYGKLIADIATTIPVVPENRDGLIKRLNDHFEVLEDLIFALNDEDLIVPEVIPGTMDALDKLTIRKSTRTADEDEWSCDSSEHERQEGNSNQ